jgi:histone acetyltransferase
LLPVDTNDVPDYTTIVSVPMDLKTMQERLESGHYTTLPAFMEDFELIITNCRTYNAPDTTYVKNANILEAFCKERLKQRDLVRS